MANLSDRELQIAQYIIVGQETREMAVALGVKASTLANYIGRIRMKTDTVGKNRVELANELRIICRGKNG